MNPAAHFQRRGRGVRLVLRFSPLSFFLAAVVGVAALPESGQPPAAEDTPDKPFLVGAASCASGNCHGSARPRLGSEINQNEYRIWATRDRHARAYEVLWEDLSAQIGRRLGIEKPWEEQRCLACHAVDRTGKVAATTFDPADGVSCEGCHGASGGWYARHFEKGWTRQQSLDAGMYDTKDTVKRARLCLSCHLGSPENPVDHRLLAAGHPDLGFELEKYSRAMPRHWREEDGPDSLRRWAAAQVLALNAEMALLTASQPSAWHGGLDFAFLECGSCHHDLRTPSVRQTRGYRFHPGAAPWNPSRAGVLGLVLSVLAPGRTADFEEAIALFEAQAAAPDAGAIQESAKNISQQLDSLLPRLLESQYDETVARRLRQALARNATRISALGIRAAEQAAMAAEVLLRAQPAETENLERRLEGLYGSLDPFDPQAFAEQLAGIQ